jgi:nitroreductase
VTLVRNIQQEKRNILMADSSSQDSVKHAHTDLPVHELIQSRWSPRSFTDQDVSDQDLKTLFTAASWAASSGNEQPWRFLVGRKGDATYEKIFNSLAEGNQLWVEGVPVLYASFGKKTFSGNGKPNGWLLHDTGAASATLALQAAAMGLQVHGMAGFDKETLRAFFGVPSDFEPGAVWALGYAGPPEGAPEKYRDAEKAPRTRKPLESFVFTEWDQPAAL